jgi:hypothetical protein
VKLAHGVFLPGSLPSRAWCLADPTRQRLSFAGGNRYAPDPLRRPVPSQTLPLPLLLAVLPTDEIPTTPHAKVLYPSLCELPVTSLRLPPRLRTTGKPHCRRGITLSCCVSRSLSSSLNRHDASAKHPVTTPRVEPLLIPSLLAPRAASSSLQLHSPSPHRHHALARPCMPCGHHQPPLSSSPPRQWRTDKRPPRRLHARPLPLRRRCCA